MDFFFLKKKNYVDFTRSCRGFGAIEKKNGLYFGFECIRSENSNEIRQVRVAREECTVNALRMHVTVVVFWFSSSPFTDANSARARTRSTSSRPTGKMGKNEFLFARLTDVIYASTVDVEASKQRFLGSEFDDRW